MILTLHVPEAALLSLCVVCCSSIAPHRCLIFMCGRCTSAAVPPAGSRQAWHLPGPPLACCSRPPSAPRAAGQAERLLGPRTSSGVRSLGPWPCSACPVGDSHPHPHPHPRPHSYSHSHSHPPPLRVGARRVPCAAGTPGARRRYLWLPWIKCSKVV